MNAESSLCRAGRLPNKAARILRAFIEGRRMTRFDAEGLGDHCLPSTVSALQARGVPIMREMVERQGQHGEFRCCVYWLTDADLRVALKLLEDMSHEAQQTR